MALTSELADNAVDTNAIANNAVTAGKLASGVQTTINNNADNRVITGSGTANTLEGESNLTYGGGNLQFTTAANGQQVLLKSTGNFYNQLSFDSNNTSAGGSLAFIDFSWDGDKVADIMAVAGSDTTNKDDGHLAFRTSPQQGNIGERMRINSSGIVGINNIGTTFGQLNVGIPSQSGGSALQVMNSSSASGDGTLTNIVLRSVNAVATTWSHAQYRAQSHQFQFQGTTKVNVNSNGLCFNSDTAAANALDDYEEGNFSIGVTDNNNTFSAGQESGKYIKIGHVVHCTFIINCTISGTSGYAFFLTGFPFTVKNYGSHANEGLGHCKGTGQPIQLEAQQDQTTMKARNPSSGSAMSVNDVGCTNNTVKSIIGYVIYQTT
jgi:hypothetical protein